MKINHKKRIRTVIKKINQLQLMMGKEIPVSGELFKEDLLQLVDKEHGQFMMDFKEISGYESTY